MLYVMSLESGLYADSTNPSVRHWRSLRVFFITGLQKLVSYMIMHWHLSSGPETPLFINIDYFRCLILVESLTSCEFLKMPIIQKIYQFIPCLLVYFISIWFYFRATDGLKLQKSAIL